MCGNVTVRLYRYVLGLACCSASFAASVLVLGFKPRNLCHSHNIVLLIELGGVSLST